MLFCCYCDVIRAAGRMAEAVCGCLLMMVCAGPILVAVGIVLLTIPNTRASDVEKYNTDAARFNATPISNWTGSIDSHYFITTTNAVSKITQPVTVETGSDDDVDEFNSVFVQATVSTSNQPQITYNIKTVEGAPSDFTPQYTSKRTATATCRRTHGCFGSYATTLCQDNYGPTAAATTTCSEDHTCKCTYDVYLHTYCLVATPSTNNNNNSSTFVMSTTYLSCYYPFKSSDQQIYVPDSMPTTIPFQLRLDTDPFIAMQRITQGDMDFGKSLAHQRSLASTLIGIGSGIIACFGIVAFILFNMVKSVKKKSGAAQPLNTAPQFSDTQYSNPQQPQMYNFPLQHHHQQYAPQQQQQQQYPPHHQQPPYGQPAPGYVLPAPAAYGQPAYGHT